MYNFLLYSSQLPDSLFRSFSLFYVFSSFSKILEFSSTIWRFPQSFHKLVPYKSFSVKSTIASKSRLVTCFSMMMKTIWKRCEP